MARHHQLAGVVATFDAVDGQATLSRHPEATKLLAFADRILLNKSDLVSTADRDAHLSDVHGIIGVINGDAAILDVNADDIDLASVTPNGLATLGVLGTFAGILVGRLHFDASSSEKTLSG